MKRDGIDQMITVAKTAAYPLERLGGREGGMDTDFERLICWPTND
jgi:hypothetical protein